MHPQIALQLNLFSVSNFKNVNVFSLKPVTSLLNLHCSAQYKRTLQKNSKHLISPYSFKCPPLRTMKKFQIVSIFNNKNITNCKRNDTATQSSRQHEEELISLVLLKWQCTIITTFQSIADKITFRIRNIKL